MPTCRRNHLEAWSEPWENHFRNEDAASRRLQRFWRISSAKIRLRALQKQSRVSEGITNGQSQHKAPNTKNGIQVLVAVIRKAGRYFFYTNKKNAEAVILKLVRKAFFSKKRNLGLSEYLCVCKVPVRDVVSANFRGCRKLERL